MRGIAEYSLWRLHRARGVIRTYDSTVMVDELEPRLDGARTDGGRGG
jgi:hypothetical protein